MPQDKLLQEIDDALTTAREREKKRHELEYHILVAAKSCFIRLGYHRTTVNDICREANVSRREFYRHFRSVDEVTNGLLEMDRGALLTAVRSIVASRPDGKAPSVHQIISIMITMIENFVSFDLGRQYIEWWAESARNEAVLPGLRETWDLWRRLLEPAIEQTAPVRVDGVSARDMANSLLLCYNGLLLLATLDRETVDFNAMRVLMETATRALVDTAGRPVPGDVT